MFGLVMGSWVDRATCLDLMRVLLLHYDRDGLRDLLSMLHDFSHGFRGLDIAPLGER